MSVAFRSGVRPQLDAGFSLLETLVATTVLLVAIVGLAHLTILAMRANQTARATTVAVIAARHKMEQLRGLKWAFDSRGGRVEDPAIAPSPANALDTNVAGYFEVLDAQGVPAASRRTSGAYVRRWSIAPLPHSSSDALVLQVRVIKNIGVPKDVRLLSIKPRQIR